MKHRLTISCIIVLVVICHPPIYAEQILSDDENAWLRRHEPIRIGPDPDFSPFQKIDDNKAYTGIAADYLALLSKRLGFDIIVASGLTLDQMLEKARNKEIDVLPSIGITEERKRYLLFTRSYLNIPVHIVTRKSRIHINQLEDLVDRTIVVVADYPELEFLKKQNFDATFFVVESIKDGLKTVSLGDVDAFLCNVVSASYYAEQLGISNLRIGGETGFSYKLSMAVRNDWPELIPILNKGIASISNTEITDIYRRWVHLQSGGTGQNRKAQFFFYLTIAVAILLSVGLFCWNHLLRRKIWLRNAALKDSEKALASSEDKYRTILDNIEEGYYELDAAGNIVFFNDSMRRILKSTDRKMNGVNILAYADEEYTDRIIDDLDHVRQAGRSSGSLSWKLRRDDGSDCYLEVSAGLIKDADDRITGFRCMARDMTDRQLFEQQRRILDEQLRKAEKMEAIGTLAGGFAHDFNNLMMTMLGNVSLMLHETDPAQPFYKRLKAVEKQIHTGSELIGQLLGYARKGAYEIVPVNLNTILKQRIAEFSLSHRDISVRQHLARDLCAIEADSGQLEHVILNLLANAADAMPEGGDIHIRTRNLPASNQKKGKPDSSAKRVQMTIQDTGTGIKEDIIERIFDPFFTTKEMNRGTGLGLASAYGIIKSHSGQINVKTKRGIGTAFTILLPAIDMRADFIKKTAVDRGLRFGLVLLVDDEEMVLDVGARMLEKIGYQVICTTDGQKAIDIFRNRGKKIDLVILDMIMPGLDGEQVFYTLKKIDPEIRVLLASGYSVDGQAEELIRQGCNGYIQKPFSLRQLSRKVKEILG